MLSASATPVLVAGASLEALATSAWRLWLAGLAFAIVAIARRRFTWQCLRLTVWAGLSFGAATALFFSALQLTSVANASVISVMQPLPLLVAARVMFGERIGLSDLTWIGVALGGSVFMVIAADSSGSADFGGDVLAAGSMLAAASYFVFGKRARESLDTDVFMTGLLFWTIVVITPLLLVSGQAIVPPDAKEWLRMASLAGVVVLGHGLINFANGRLPLAAIGLFQLVVPGFAALLAWIFLDQSITVWQALAMAVVLASLAGHTRYTARAQA
jgi:drug/metabolite transporter (DMT)-like permease